MKKWRSKNRDKIIRARKEYTKNNMKKLSNNALAWQRKNLDSWKEFFPFQKNCPICGKLLFFHSKDHGTTFYFDHRNEGLEIIKGSPSRWLAKHPRNKENEKLFLSCNFGILCSDCNRRLPTQNRKNWILNAVKYIFNFN